MKRIVRITLAIAVLILVMPTAAQQAPAQCPVDFAEWMTAIEEGITHQDQATIDHWQSNNLKAARLLGNEFAGRGWTLSCFEETNYIEDGLYIRSETLGCSFAGFIVDYDGLAILVHTTPTTYLFRSGCDGDALSYLEYNHWLWSSRDGWWK